MQKYFTLILGSGEFVGLESPEGDREHGSADFEDLFSLKAALKMFSIFGTASTGVNAPNLFYLYLSTQKPITHKLFSIL